MMAVACRLQAWPRTARRGLAGGGNREETRPQAALRSRAGRGGGRAGGEGGAGGRAGGQAAASPQAPPLASASLRSRGRL